MPPEDGPHLEHPDVQPDTAAATDRLRAAAVREEVMKPMTQRIERARDLLHELRGFIAGKGFELPIDVEQKLTTWWHEDVMARKEQQS